jgi:ATP-dependent helicase/nuclease subunit A
VRNAQALSDELLDLLEGVQLDAVLRTSIQRFAAFAGGYTPTSVWDSQALESKFGSVLLAGIGDLEKGELVIPYNRRRYALPPRACEILLGLLHHVLGIEMDRCLQETRGLYHVLRHYEGVYDERMLARGRLTFDDIYHLLAPGRGDLSRLNIDYRLDSRLDHWLLDEFQDTSDLQWAALGNLADEVLQDTAGTRSFFYVGDIKQAIYGWRGGNARLFDQLARRYGDRIERHPLHASYRSCPQVIDAVNRVFSGLPDGLPPEAEKRWKSAWAKHETAADHVPGSGYVALVEPRATDEGKPKAADRYRAVAGLLKEIRPLDRGLTVAVLVRTNDAARDVVQQLRAECPGLTVVHEGVASLCDNAVVSLLLSLVQFAAHPGDTMAWRHVQMSPLGEGADRDALSPATLREIQEEGFAAVFRRAGDTLAERGALDDYGRLRLGDLVEAAGAFDRQGSRDVNGFLDFMEGYTRKELASSSAVRVMTVHQAKGLGFDVVLLPDLNDESMVKAKDFDFRVERDDATGAARWALRMPRKLVAEQDPVLADQLRKADAEDSFASLCVLYVAMTRAARALYLVTSFPGKDAKTQSPAAYVKARLAGAASSMELGGETFDVLFEQGDRAWFRDVKAGDAREAKSRPARKKSPRAARAVRRRLLDVSPSRRAEHTRSGDLVFAAQTHRSLGIGSALHALFEKVGWLEETDVDAAVAAWEAGADLSPEDQAVVLRQFRACLANDAIRAALARPSPGAALWREKRFDVVLGDEWVTGSFDRVIVEEGRAVVLDFKSNDIESEDHLKQVAEGYAPQMALYRRAVARLLGWNESQVACSLVFTAVGRVVAL